MIISRKELRNMRAKIATLEKANELYRKEIRRLENDNKYLIASMRSESLDFPNNQIKEVNAEDPNNVFFM